MGFGKWFCAKYFRSQLLHHPFALRELYVIALFYVIYVLAVLRLLCALYPINWQFMLNINIIVLIINS